MASETLIAALYVFALAAFLGYQVISRVPPLLHTPLMSATNYIIEFSYLLASILFILGLKGLSHPETAKRGMHLAELGMLMAVIGTLLHHEIASFTWILTGLAIGSVVGLAMGFWVPMTA